MNTAARPCTGSLQEKNGIWYTVIQVTVNGKRKSKWETTHLKVRGNKRKAQALLEERKAQYELLYMSGEGGSLDDCRPADLLFTDYLLRWTLTQKGNVSFATNQCRERMLNGRIRGFFGPRSITLQRLSPLDIEDFYQDLRTDGLKGSTLLHYHQFMNQALEAAARKDILPKNPMKKVDRPRKKPFTGSFYTKEEALQLMELFKGDPMYALIVTAVYYGMRRSELLGLTWDSVDFESNTISVAHKVYRDNAGGDARGLVISSELKTTASRRTLPLVPAVREVLLAERIYQHEQQRLLKGEYCRDYLSMVFVDAAGNLFTPDAVTRHFHAVVARSDLKMIRFHDLRHTCASLLVANGVDMKLVQLWLGHANYSTTADIYSHLDSGAQGTAAETISALFREAAPKSA